MNRLIFTLCAFYIIINGCNYGVDKSLISETEKLTSPNGVMSLYRYHIESSMAFGSGVTVLKIVNSEDGYNFTSSDYLRFGNDYPFWIRWKNEDTLTVKCLMEDNLGPSPREHVKKEVKKWKDWIFEVEYFKPYAFTIETEFKFDSYSISTNFFVFKAGKDSIQLDKRQVQFSLDTNQIHANNFKIDTLQNEVRVSFYPYLLTPTKPINKNDFLKEQAFTKIER